jgi:hypothetical protein
MSRAKIRTAHAVAEVDGVKFRFELRANADLVIRRDRKRRGVTYTAAELVRMSERHREGSLRL